MITNIVPFQMSSQTLLVAKDWWDARQQPFQLLTAADLSDSIQTTQLLSLFIYSSHTPTAAVIKVDTGEGGKEIKTI